MLGMKDSYTGLRLRVVKLHAQLASGACAEIWQSSDERFRSAGHQSSSTSSATSSRDASALFVIGASRLARSTSTAAASMCSFGLKSQFEKGEATENFMFWKHSAGMELTTVQTGSIGKEIDRAHR